MSTAELLSEVESFRPEMEGYVEEMGSRNGLSLTRPGEVIRYVEEYGISSIRLWFADIPGFLKSFSVTPAELPDAFEEGMGFDGSSIEGYQRIQESDIRYQEALRMADSLQTHKYLVKEVARCCCCLATFMPKPIQTENGSGMHTHISVFEDEKTNAIYSPDDPHHLSQTAKHFIAGVLEHAREMAVVTNQWFNSYKRLVPGYEAPVYVAWAERKLPCPDPMTIDLSGLSPVERDEVHRTLVETKLIAADKFRLHVSAKDLEEHLVL